MRLARPFYRLPVRFDYARLHAELALIPRSAWAAHPSGTPGNSALRLLSVDGGENDDVNGTIGPTPVLAQLPYVRQVLASFGVVWSRSRFMRLAPGANVEPHSDINYHWHYRVRIHIPVVTRPEVLFHCGDEHVHMAAGEAWIFDSWRQHRVDNPTEQERIHLVADTTGSAAFWRFVALSMQPGTVAQQHSFRADWDPPLRLERVSLAPVMAPAEVDLLLLDMRGDLTATELGPQGDARVAGYAAMLDSFSRDWRQLYLVHGESRVAWDEYAALRRDLREASRAGAEGVAMRSNGVHAHRVLEARLLRSLLPQVPEPDVPAPASRSATGVAARAQAKRRPRSALLERPLFIIAAPRSGSTLLYETLAVSGQLANLGGEAPWLIEDIPALRPGASGVESNRLLAEQATDDVRERIRAQALARLLDADGRPIAAESDLRLLEKTPKNALRVPFLDRVFPDALFLLLWREPRENLSSIIEAWRSERWVTYPRLEGFAGPWSLLLPPGWPAMSGRTLGEIAAFQWEAANRIALDDLQRLEPARWAVLDYAELVADPAASVRRICRFADLEFDSGLMNRLVAPLPLSRYTQSPPAPDKWRKNAALIEPVLPALAPLRARLAAIQLSHQSGNRADR